MTLSSSSLAETSVPDLSSNHKGDHYSVFLTVFPSTITCVIKFPTENAEKFKKLKFILMRSITQSQAANKFQLHNSETNIRTEQRIKFY